MKRHTLVLGTRNDKKSTELQELPFSLPDLEVMTLSHSRTRLRSRKPEDFHRECVFEATMVAVPSEHGFLRG